MIWARPYSALSIQMLIHHMWCAASTSSNPALDDKPEVIGENKNIVYRVWEVPPLPVTLVLGFQHYLTMLGATVVIPTLLVPAMGGGPDAKAQVVQRYAPLTLQSIRVGAQQAVPHPCYNLRHKHTPISTADQLEARACSRTYRADRVRVRAAFSLRAA